MLFIHYSYFCKVYDLYNVVTKCDTNTVFLLSTLPVIEQSNRKKHTLLISIVFDFHNCSEDVCGRSIEQKITYILFKTITYMAYL